VKRSRVGRIAAVLTVSAVAAGAFLVFGAGAASAATSEGAVISNGTVTLGVNADGSLNYDCAGAGDSGCPPPSVEGIAPVGLRFTSLNLEATSDGCLCEGWGVADAGSGLTGGASVDNPTPPAGNTTVDSFSSPSPTEAISTVTVADPSIPGFAMKVEQDYHTTPLTPNVFVDSVKVTNTGSNDITDLRYRRAMDWDIEPTAFSEWVTNQGTPSELKFDSDDGFASVDPLAGPSYIDSEAVCGTGYTGQCQFTDLGSGGQYPTVMSPDDHGGLFDFGFGSLAAGATKTFTVVYGAADSETNMLNALNASGAQTYSMGESNCAGDTIDTCGPGTGPSQPPHSGVEQGKPAAFAFAFVVSTADVSITKTATPPVVAVNENLTYDLTVTNNGPNQAAGITVDDPLPAGADFVSATADSGGSCSGTTDVSCSIPSLSSGQAAHITIVVKPTLATSALTNTAKVSTLSDDPNPSNDSASVTTRVTSKPVKCQGPRATIVGTPGNDTLIGTPGPDVIAGQGGNDLLKGLGGNDKICGKEGNDKIIGAGGNDKLHGGPGKDNETGGAGKDLVKGGGAADKLKGNGGKDNVRGGSGKDQMSGGGGNDLLKAHGGGDQVQGNGGNDKLGGGAQFDHLNGGSGKNKCSPGPDGAKLTKCVRGKV
jgi:uncharacterized repeat protein (TIGR01451 family)